LILLNLAVIDCVHGSYGPADSVRL
jgi:hypothetical protein